MFRVSKFLYMESLRFVQKGNTSRVFSAPAVLANLDTVSSSTMLPTDNKCGSIVETTQSKDTQRNIIVFLHNL